jgi:hypothetical protein
LLDWTASKFCRQSPFQFPTYHLFGFHAATVSLNNV